MALAEVDPDRQAKAGHDWGLVTTASLDELLELDLDVVDLCTPPAGHEQQIARSSKPACT